MTPDTRDRVRKKYSKGGERYDQTRLEGARGRLLSGHDVRLFLDMLPPFDPRWKVLEVGAGTGRFTMPAIERGYRLTATDINETMLRQLRFKLSRIGYCDRCDTQVEDVFDLSFPDDHFDVVLGFHLIPRFMTLEDQRAAILEVARTIKPGGHFLFNYRNRKSLLYGRFHRSHATTPGQIDEMLLEGGLQIMQARGKMMLNRRLLNVLPLVAGRAVTRLDWKLVNRQPARAWDVFVLAGKR